MYEKRNAAQRWQATDGGSRGRADRSNQQPYSSTGQGETQQIHAPSGDMPAYVRNGMIYVAGRHLARVQGDELQRTFDATRELLRGSLLFRLDVLGVAVDAGAATIVATDRRTGKRWRVDLATFRRRGWSYNHARFGRQIGLALSEWELISSDEGTPAPVQLGLFGEGVA